jgi:hypothetical protein
MTPVVLSAADAGYFRCLLQLATSLARTQPAGTVRCVAWDLGITPEQRTDFVLRFPDWRLESFDFSRRPPHLRVRRHHVNTNAWKPVIVREELAAAGAPLLWLDSATVVLRPLGPVFEAVLRTGLYTPFGGGSPVAVHTHPETLAAMGAPAWVAQARQRASGVIGLDPARAPVRRLVEDWEAACLQERIIDPPGADRSNHRYDQSVLNLLLYPMAAREGIALTDDEIDVSSPRPTPLYRTRNKVVRWLPLAADPLVRAWYASYRFVDVMLHRRKQRPR